MNQRNAILRHRGGFTLMELLIVLTIISILASVVLLAVNPNRQLGKGRDTERLSDVNTILNAVYQYQIDHGQLPAGIPLTTARQICKDTAATCMNGVRLRVLSGSYLVAIPIDPHASATGTGTDYTIVQDANGRLTVSAPNAEQSSAISVTR